MSEARTHSNGDNVVDRVYGALERGAEILGTVLGVDMRPEVSAEIEHRKVIDATCTETPAIGAVSSRGARHLLGATSAPALPTREPFQILESIDATTGKTAWTVTNGVESADCPSRDFAQQVLEALRAKGAR